MTPSAATRPASAQSVTLLCCDPTEPDWSAEDLEVLMGRFGGHFQPFHGMPVFSFADAQAALHTALLLQGTCRRPIRAALHTCDVEMADVAPKSLTVGRGLQVVLALMLQSAPGSIQMCPDSYRTLASGLDRHSRGAIVTAEFDGDEVTCAYVTPTPTASAAYSTFAGLGMA